MPAVKKRRIALLPVDARPAVREQVVQLVATADCELLVPPLGMLGHFRRPGHREALADWLLAQAESVDGFVISLDMLVYGGLVPSRFIDDSLESLLDRLGVIAVLKQRHPHKPVYAFAATMRISNNNVAEEEKSYWYDYGELIWQWSYYTDKFLVDGDQESGVRAREAESKIPDEVRTDYLATRARNFALTKAALELCDYDGINGLVLPQDDTAQYGFNIAERRALEGLVREKTLEDWVRIYAGADEVAHTLCAHLVNEIWVAPKIKFYCAFSDPNNIDKLTARYEDKPLRQAIRSQIDVVDGELVDDLASADVLLAVHTQGESQGDWAMCIDLPQRPGLDPRWLSVIAQAQRIGKPIGLVDLAYANGGDAEMIERLQEKIPLNTLAAYAGWNTASNSIGSVVAQCSLARKAYSSAANQQVLCLRLLEDYLYQAIWRQRIRADVNESELSANALEARVSEMFVPAANAWLAGHRFGFRVESIDLPWQRTFEIGIQLSERSA